MIVVQPERSLLLRTLLRALPQIREKLTAHESWDGIRVREPATGDSYLRVVCRDVLVSPKPERTYRLAVHSFRQAHYEGRFHNHRWPLAVLALAAGGVRREALYEMPWEVRRGGETVGHGRELIRSGDVYAIDECLDVFHSVRSLGPHVSIVLADVTAPAARENRLEVEPLSDLDVPAILDEARAALALQSSTAA